MPRPDAISAQLPATGVGWMLGVVAGSALQLQQADVWPGWTYAAVAVLALLLGLALWRCRPAPWWACWVLGLALAWGWAGWRACSFQAQALLPALEQQDIRVVGVIDGMPQAVERGVRLLFRIEQAHSLGPAAATVVVPPLVTLTWYGAAPEQGLAAGQRWAWTVRLKAPHGARNPHGMDWELWLWAQGIQATGYVRQSALDAAPQWLAQTWHAPVAQWRGHLHRAMQAPAGSSARMQDAWGVVQALVTGAQSSISHGNWQLFRDTGVAHLVSISGLHITMFAWLAMALVNALWRRWGRACLWCPAPTAAGWAGLALAALYAVFSGWGIPAQRTVGMLCMVVALRAQGRVWPWPYVWLVVLTAVVLAEPWALLQAGFWLSFVAVAVLFAAQPQVIHGTGPVWRQQGLRLLREQAVVGLALAPLTLVLFGQISVVGFLANLWAIPWITLVVTPLSMLGAVWPLLWHVAAWCVSAMVWLLEQMAAWPMAVAYFAQPPWWAGMAGVLGCLWMAMPWPWRLRVLGAPALLPMLWWQAAVPPPGQFDVLALDVGQGSAVLVRTAGHSLLFDAGPKWGEQANAGERTVLPLLRAWGVQLDRMVISHADSDHAGGAAALALAQPQLQWWGAGGQPCWAGQHWQWDGVQFEMLHPPQRLHHSARSSNASSRVLRVRSASGQVALLTGDIEAEQENALLAAGAPLQADLVVVPHHGSKTSSSPAWVQAVSPRIAIVQAGYRNRFGHPAAPVMQRYEAAGSTWVQTPRCGAAYWQSVAAHTVQCEREQQRRYWQYPTR